MKLTIKLTHLSKKITPKQKREALEVVQELVEEAIVNRLHDMQWMPKWIKMTTRIQGGK